MNFFLKLEMLTVMSVSRRGMHAGSWCGNLKEGENTEDLSVYGDNIKMDSRNIIGGHGQA